MLARKNRVNTALCSQIMKDGSSVFTPLLSLRYMKNAPYPRFSVLVSKKVAKTAVERVSTRRRVYGILNHATLPKLYALISVKKSIKDISYQELTREVHNLLAKVRP